jgi:hypothetical protein
MPGALNGTSARSDPAQIQIKTLIAVNATSFIPILLLNPTIIGRL